MSGNVVGHAEGQAQEILDVGGVIGQAGAHVIRLEDADGEVFGDGDVPAAAHLHGEGIGGVGHGCGYGEDAVKAVHAAEQRFGEHAAFVLRAGTQGVARPGHELQQAQVDTWSDIRGMVPREIRGHAEAVVEGEARIEASALGPEVAAAAGRDVGALGGVGERQVEGGQLERRSRRRGFPLRACYRAAQG